MAYDVRLEKRIDATAADWKLIKRDMFGGLAYFTPGDNMCFAIMGEAVLFRVGEEQTAKYMAMPGIYEANMGGRIMKNWLLAGGEAITGDENLQRVLGVGHAFAMVLPPKMQ